MTAAHRISTATAPRLYSLESTGRPQFGAHLMPRAATGPQRRSHHSRHKQPRMAPGTPGRSDYDGAELAPYQGRPGAMDAQALPSRRGRWLHYRDGRIAQVPVATGS